MRIIKGEDIKNLESIKIFPMVFDALSDSFNIDQSQGDSGGNGGINMDDEEKGPDIEEIRKEAEKMMVDAAHDAENTREQSRLEAERMVAQARDEANQFKAQSQIDLEQAKREGFAAGYASGEEMGYKKGYDDGFVKGKQAGLEETANAVKTALEAVEQLKAYHLNILTDSQKDVARMALAVAKKVLHKEIMTDPKTVVSVIKEALSRVSFKKQFVILVNPLDLDVIKNSSEDVKTVLDNYESLKFKASAKVETGGCIVQTESGTVDAQIDRQFSEVEAAVINALDDTEA